MNIYTIILEYLEYPEDYSLTWRRTADTEQEALDYFISDILPHYYTKENETVGIHVRDFKTGLCLIMGNYDTKTKSFTRNFTLEK
jgi:hypothetical protein